MLVTGKVPIQFLGGPVRIVQAASSQAAEGVPAFLLFLTLLSANLAVINFLPIPALDGGHMMFLAAEAVRGKPVDENWQIRLTMAGVLGLLCLMAFVIINDIVQIIR
jgi:regulator of sigma E protease